MARVAVTPVPGELMLRKGARQALRKPVKGHVQTSHNAITPAKIINLRG